MESADGPVHPFLVDQRPIFGSLFSGIGGFDLGLERAGWRCAWQVEIDEWRSRVLARHWPDVPRWGDVRGFPPNGLWPNEQEGRQGLAPTGSYEGIEYIRRTRSDFGVDLICGGFPCQDLSVAGRREGLKGERSGLFFEFARVAELLKPRWLLVENVPGLLSSNQGQDMGIVLEALSELGYGLAWTVLDSQYFGVPQRRRRVFIVGHLGAPCPPEVLFEPESCGGNPQESGEKRKGVARGAALSIEDVGGKQSGGPEVGRGYREGPMCSLQRGHQHGVAQAIEVSGPPWTRRDDEAALIAQPLRSNRWGGSDSHGDEGNIVAFATRSRGSGGKQAEIMSGGISPSLTNPGAGGRADAINVCAPITAGYGKGVGVNDSATKGSPKNMIVSSYSVRRLTPIECSRLQAFPDDWVHTHSDPPFSDPCPRCPDGRRYAALGDAVTVSVIEWIGYKLLKAHNAG